MSQSKPKLEFKLLVLLALVKLAIHVLVNVTADFGLHRDEYLYLAEGDHLAWGFMEVPPMIPLIAWVTKGLFGISVVAVRLSPALIGSASVLLVGMMVKEMGGKRIAQLTAAIGIIVSSIFLGSNNLFQPVSFNQFWWLVICYLSIKIINQGDRKYWIFLGLGIGLAILTKYSVGFLVIALLGAILISNHRQKLLDKRLLLAISLALLISLPNIHWQVKYDFPVVRHMTDLASSQLVNMSLMDFLVPQVLFHFGCAFLWLSGLVYVFIHSPMKKYRYLGWTYILLFLLILSLDGKAYYLFGIYSTMYALGGMAWERWLGKRSYYAIAFIAIINIPSYFYALPFLSPDSNVKVMSYIKDKFGLDAPLRWETGEYEVLPQDYADMLGWQELPEKVSRIYHSLTAEEKARTMIYGGSYGHAGVLNLWKEKYDLPTTQSLSSSFVAWAQEDFTFDRQIFIDDVKQTESSFFNTITLMDSIEHPLARDPGYIYYRTGPKTDVEKVWKEIVIQAKKEAGLIK